MPKTKKDLLLLVDGNALVHRGFHAIPHLSTKKGEPVNGVYGFALLFLRAIKELAPKYVVVAFDYPAPTFREKIYEPYKATRIKAPDELYAQIPRVKELVQAFGVSAIEMPGYEADDIIGSIAERVKKEADLETIILTGDLDTLQLVNDNVRVYAPKQGLTETKLYDREAVKARYGLAPEQILDYKALRGDPSDNIPGVKGIGEKTASELLQKFGSLEEIYDYLARNPSRPAGTLPSKGEGNKEVTIKPRIAQLLLEHKKDAEISKKLAALVKDLNIEFDLTKAILASYDEQKVYKLFQELEFKSLLDKLPKRDLSTPSSSSPYQGGERVGVTGEGLEEKSNYQLIDTKEKYQKFLAELKKQKEFAIDTETTSMNPLAADLLGIGFCWEKGRAFYVVKNVIDGELRKILQDPKITLVGHNIKYDYLVLKRPGINLQGRFFDTMVAAYLLNPSGRNFNLDTLTFNEFGFRKLPITALIGGGRNQLNMSAVPVPKVADYCCEDADYTWRLRLKLEPELRKMRLEKIFFEIEMSLVPVLAKMEWLGVKIDPLVLRKLSRQVAADLAKLKNEIYKLAGEEFNIGSPIQLKKILFEKLNIPTEELKKGKTGLSTAATELEKLRGLHPIIDKIFEWRELAKLQNTYIEALPALIDKQTGRVHTSFNQTTTATGRLSSSDPNLQNIPIRTQIGRQIRRAFVAEKGYKLVSIDYSQIELRLAAHLSGDRKMIEVFRKGGDIHEATAREIFGEEKEGVVTPEMRRAAKTINFGVLYGLSAYGLKTRIPHVSQGEAQDFIDKYFDTYSQLTKYLEKIVVDARRLGYVKNEVGRIRFLPEIRSSQFQVRSAAERAAINMPFQSLSADIIKMAMNKLAEEGLTNREDCRLLLQVHDELVFEVKENRVTDYAKKISAIMAGIYKLKVPLVVEAKAGDDWEDMHPLSFLPLDKGEMKRG